MTDTPITLPWDSRAARPSPFDPPAIFGTLRDERPLRPMTFADGHIGWLATGYQVARTILADQRFSIRRDLAHFPVTLPHAQEQQAFMAPPAPGLFLRLDPPEHTRYRQLLVGEFTAHRMKQLEARIAKTTSRCLDEMEQAGPPTDLVEALAVPIPTLVICELLGISPADRIRFQQARDITIAENASDEQIQQAYTAMLSIFPPLIQSKRATPTDDIYSGLINNSDLTDEEITSIGMLLFGAGFVTTTNMLSLGTFALLRHPDQLDALRRDPTLIGNTVEELLRQLPGPTGMLRTALDDVEIEGELIRKGQTVEVLVTAANHDPARFDNPDELDITRPAHGHLTFGHGIHQCLGQQLARVELRIVFRALFDRFPDLRLAMPVEEVPLTDNSAIYGVKRLLVSW